MIDAHVHLFPDEAAGRAWQELAGFSAVRPGTVDDLGPRMAAAGIDRAIVLLFPRSAQRFDEITAATDGHVPQADAHAAVRREIRALNRWGCGLARRDPRFDVFVGVNPRFMAAAELVAEIEAGRAAGARGVKIIPPAMRLYPDDPLLAPVFATCAEFGLPLLSQSGSGGSAAGSQGPYGRPWGFAPVLAAFPRLRLVLAHLGRGYEVELIALAARFPGVFADTSLALGHPKDTEAWDPAPVRSLIRRLGADRVLFGTNYPTTDPVEYRGRFEALRLSAGEAAAVAHDNALRLLGSSERVSRP